MKYLDEAISLNVLGEDVRVVIRSLGGEDGDLPGECHILKEVTKRMDAIAALILQEQNEKPVSAVGGGLTLEKATEVYIPTQPSISH